MANAMTPHGQPIDPAAIASMYPRVSIVSAKRVDTLPPDPVGPRTILLVDHEQRRRSETAAALHHDGFRVLELCGAEAVVDAARTLAPDIILLQTGPAREASHVELCRALRGSEWARMTPVIVLGEGTEADEDAVVGALDAGADDYIGDPTRMSELRARVRAQLRYHRDREVLQWTREQRSNFRDLALTDTLTGIANRRSLLKATAEVLERREAASFVLVDLDHFKQVNDTFGHAVGDMVLRRVARALSASAPAGSVVARWGGEEFAVVHRGEPGEGPRSAGERYRRAIEGIAFSGPAEPRSITASVGVVPLEGEGDIPSTAEIFEAADEALYRSKKAGRNRVSVGLR